MKGLAALAIAGVIAAAGGFWFMSNPVVVHAQRKPLQPDARLPTFHRVQTDLMSQQAPRHRRGE